MVDTVAVDVSAQYSPDAEVVTLTETGPSTGVFEGAVALTSGPDPGPGTLKTSNSGPPAYLYDQVTATFGGASATATTIGSRVSFIDEFGQVVTVVPVNAPLRVRVVDQNANNPGSVDSFSLWTFSQQTGDVEFMALTETGSDTGIFEGSLATSTTAFFGLNQILSVGFGDTITVLHTNVTNPASTRATATTAGSAVQWLDAAGQPATVFLEGDLAYLQVISHLRNTSPGVDTVEVSVSSDLGGDYEPLTLTETGGSTGVFKGSIRLQIGTGNGYDGYLQVNESAGPPHEYDTLIAQHYDGYAWADATATTLGSRTWLVDGLGGDPVESFESGSFAYVRVEDHNRDVPGVVDTVGVTLSSEPTGDVEVVTLTETGTDTGVFEGVVDLQNEPLASIADGQLQTQEGGRITVSHEDALGFTFSGDQAEITEVVNTAPVVEVSFPTATTFFAGELVSFVGTATDAQEGDLTSQLEWVSDLDGPIGTSGSFSTASLSVGSHTITASVTDGGGLPGSFSIPVDIAPNTAPVVEITAPLTGATVTATDPITFAGSATDVEEGDLTAGLSWVSDLDGTIGTGGSFQMATLSIGLHTITASLVDGGGVPGSAVITVQVNANVAPTVTITSPANGTTFTATDPIVFTATATDPEDGNLAASVAWSSDLDGALGTGASLNVTTLSVGSHTITASVTDSHGSPGSAVITVQVNANTPPVVTTTSPARVPNSPWVTRSPSPAPPSTPRTATSPRRSCGPRASTAPSAPVARSRPRRCRWAATRSPPQSPTATVRQVRRAS
ncbi:MAG: hypothetical protein HC897_08690 [Thermoanaerobaculia bacterium]|nr:hypothetical protein [Thermoanaerobaculia bacterium]